VAKGRQQEPNVVVRVEYIDDPERASAARAILRQGLHRALTRLMAQQAAKTGAGPAGEDI
jgi:hypothetical protein